MAYKFRKGSAVLSGSVETDDIMFVEDPDTGLDFASDTINMETGGAVRIRLKNDFTEITNGIKHSNLKAINSNYVATNADYCLACINTSAITITLPTKNNNGGQQLIIKDANGNASTNNITIDGNGSDTIDGGASFTIAQDFKCVTLMCDGTQGWFVLSTNL